MKKTLLAIASVVIVSSQMSFADEIKECKTAQDKIDGCIEFVYRDTLAKKIEEQIPYVEGKIEGMRKWFYKDGSLGWEQPYIQGKAEGLQKIYYPSGAIKIEETYKDDLVEGLTKWYYESGKLYREVPNQNGFKNGVEKWYYENGTILQEISYVNGKKDGVENKYDENGKLTATRTFKEGDLLKGKCANGKDMTEQDIENFKKFQPYCK